MARVQAYQPLQMGSLSVFYGDVIRADSDEIWIDDGYHKGIYQGQFTYPNDGVAGTLTSYQSFFSGVRQYKADNFRADASVVYELVQSGQMMRLMEYVLGGDDLFNGSNGADELMGFTGNDTIYGNGGADFLSGGAGDDMLFGGAGDDGFASESGNDVIDGGAGIDTLYFSVNPARVNLSYLGKQQTGDGIDQILNIENVSGSSGGDLIRGSAQANRLDGLDGMDSLFGYGGNDTLDGGFGADVLFGGDGHDHLIGGWGNDRLDGGSGNDTLEGGSGDDVLKGGAGADVLDGGAGVDLVSYAGSVAVSVDLGAGVAWSGGQRDILIGIEKVQGSDGADRLVAGEGTVMLFGGAGDDVLLNGFGTRMIGGDGNDRIQGGASSERLEGGAGNDFLHGVSGNDILFGGAGNDTLRGDTGNDRLLGGSGDDYLDGGQNNDLLAGGAGADRFVFGRLDGFDRISDFENGIDRIEFRSGANSFDDLTIRQVGSETRIAYGDDQVTLVNFDSRQLGAEDFIFS